jgi:hypothetical protein
MATPYLSKPYTYQLNPQPGDLKIYTFELEVNGAKHLYEWDGPARQLRDVTDDVPTDAIVPEVPYPGQGQMYYIADDGSVMQDRIIPGTIKQETEDGTTIEFSNIIYGANGMISGDGEIVESGQTFDVEQRFAKPVAALHVFYPNGEHADPVLRYDQIEITLHKSKGEEQEYIGFPTRTEIKPTSVREINTPTVQPTANAATTGAK